jgi:hypothetical protein
MIKEKTKAENENSSIMQYAIKMLKGIIEDIENGECGEAELADAMQRLNSQNKDCFKEDDFVNYDEAGLLLDLRWNRKRISELCKEYGIKNIRFKNKPIGFRKIEILKLKNMI